MYTASLLHFGSGASDLQGYPNHTPHIVDFTYFGSFKLIAFIHKKEALELSQTTVIPYKCITSPARRARPVLYFGPCVCHCCSVLYFKVFCKPLKVLCRSREWVNITICDQLYLLLSAHNLRLKRHFWEVQDLLEQECYVHVSVSPVHQTLRIPVVLLLLLLLLRQNRRARRCCCSAAGGVRHPGSAVQQCSAVQGGRRKGGRGRAPHSP